LIDHSASDERQHVLAAPRRCRIVPAPDVPMMAVNMVALECRIERERQQGAGRHERKLAGDAVRQLVRDRDPRQRIEVARPDRRDDDGAAAREGRLQQQQRDDHKQRQRGVEVEVEEPRS
jgi:hypothetical protein